MRIDMTPTWAAIMPALIAALQNGTPDGQEIAASELKRLAASVDKANADARQTAAPAEKAAPAGGFLAETFARYAGQNVADADNARTPAGRALYMGRASAFYIAARDAAPYAVDSGPYTARASECYESALAARDNADAAPAELAGNLAALSAHGFELAARDVFKANAPDVAQRPGIFGTRGAWAIYDSAEGAGGDADGFAIVGDCPAELARAARAHVLPVAGER